MQLLITDKGKEKSIKTGVTCKPEHWDDRNQKLKPGFPLHRKVNLELWNMRLKYEQAAMMAVMDGGGLKEVLKNVQGAKDQRNFIEFGLAEVEKLKTLGKEGNAYTYTTALKQLEKSFGQLSFDELTSDLLCEWRDVKLASGVSASAVHTYLRTLRAIWNRSDTVSPSPFVKGVFPKARKRMPRNNSLEEVQLIFSFSPTDKQKGIRLARDMWCLGFLLRGMDFVDLIHLEVEDLQGHHFMYRRKKTHEELRVRIFPEAREIINRYGRKGFLFPILNTPSEKGKSYQQQKNQLSRMNRSLARLSAEVAADVRFTTKTCRYSFASLAKEMGVDYSIIREMLGHKEKGVTSLYLDSYPQKIIDEAHEKVLSLIRI